MSIENFSFTPKPQEAPNTAPISLEQENIFAPNPEDINKEARRIWEAEFEDISEDNKAYRTLEQVTAAVQLAVEQYGWPDDAKVINTGLRLPVSLAYQRAIYL